MTNWTEGVCDTNGVAIHYSRTGGDKPPLIALHGLTGSGACWAPLARALEGDCDVVAPDARGHGKSSAPPHGYLYPDHANDVVSLIDRLALAAPFLLGHSMGGMTAALAAAQLGTKIRGVVLVDPTFLRPARQRDVHGSGVVERHREWIRAGRDQALAEARLRHPDRSRELLEIVIDARLQTDINAFEVLQPPNPDYRALARAISVPILLVLGEHGVLSLETARELHSLNPRLRYELMPNVGHGIPYDRPDALAALVRSFLRSADARGQCI